jgi:hypothetical protein
MALQPALFANPAPPHDPIPANSICNSYLFANIATLFFDQPRYIISIGGLIV